MKNKNAACELETVPISVYYDGMCPLCSREINIYKKEDEHGKIRFVDISSSHFSAQQEGVDPDKVQRVFHVKTAEDGVLTGVDGFVTIWDTLGIFRPMSVLAKSSLIRPLFQLGYNMFAQIRPLLPKRQCQEGTCRV